VRHFEKPGCRVLSLNFPATIESSRDPQFAGTLGRTNPDNVNDRFGDGRRGSGGNRDGDGDGNV